MTTSNYDVIIVGARCAGAAAAMLLARRGRRVLLIDRDNFPSDMSASTHFIWSSGVERLKKWGLLEDLQATNCHGESSLMLDIGVTQLIGRAPTRETGFDSCYAPRRIVFDNLLVQNALKAGVDLQVKSSVEKLLFNDERVVGVQYRNANGEDAEARASIVLGADGMNSTVAKLVNAEKYNEHPVLQQTFYSYFDDVELSQTEFYSRPGRQVFAWTSNDGVVVAGVCCRTDQCKALKKDIDHAFWSEMDANAPDLSEKLKNGKRVEDWRTASAKNFVRKAGGPGWALIGDAGITMDPITAAGISNALLQADLVTDAIDQGLSNNSLDAEIVDFESRRDSALLPHYEFTVDMARLDPEPPEDFMQLLMALPGQQEEINNYFGVFAMTVPIGEFFAPDNVQRIVQGSPKVA